MRDANFVRITRIDQSPEIDLNDYPEVRGKCLVIASDGAEVEVDWERPQDHDSAFLVGVSESLLTHLDRGCVEVGLTDAIDRIEHDATIAAEAAWTDVWVAAAVAADDDDDEPDSGLEADLAFIRKTNDDTPEVW